MKASFFLLAFVSLIIAACASEPNPAGQSSDRSGNQREYMDNGNQGNTSNSPAADGGNGDGGAGTDRMDTLN